jgi:hypothetical protein
MEQIPQDCNNIICKTNNRAKVFSQFIYKRKFQDKPYFIGLELLYKSKKSTMKVDKKEVKFYKDDKYIIKKIDGDKYSIYYHAEREKIITLSKKIIQDNFILKYAYTCDSCQGMSIDEKFIIDLTELWLHGNTKWLYTAITRCTDLDNIILFDCPKTTNQIKSQINYIINSNIRGHAEYDLKRFGKFLSDPSQYIDNAWFWNKLMNSNCRICGEGFDVESSNECFSANRLNNNIGHLKVNSELLHRICNNGLH